MLTPLVTLVKGTGTKGTGIDFFFNHAILLRNNSTPVPFTLTLVFLVTSLYPVVNLAFLAPTEGAPVP